MSKIKIKSRPLPSANRDHKARAKQPNKVDQLLRAAIACKKSGNHRESFTKMTLALKLAPENQEVHYQLAALHQDIGEIDLAIQAVKTALKLNPFFTDALRLLAELTPDHFGEKHLTEIKRKIEAPLTTDNERANLAFTLFEIYAATNNHSESFKYLTLGNRSKRRTFHFDFNEQRDFLLKVRDYFTTCYQEFRETLPPAKITPIFIVGMPRSGTTLVEQILASHPKVAAGGELLFLPETVKTLLAAHVTLSGVTTSNLDRNHLKKYAAMYLDRLAPFLPKDKKYLTDKMPQNFFFLGLIKVLFPGAKIVHCRRHPMATAFSCYKTLFTEKGQQFSFDLKELGQFYLFYRETMAHWQDLLAGDIFDIRYENIVADQVGASRKLLDFCGLPWHDRCLDFHKTRRVVTTASALQVIKPIYTSSLAQWENHRENLAPLLALIGDDALPDD